VKFIVAKNNSGSEMRISKILSRMAKSSHRAGTFGSDVLLALASVLPKGPLVSLETGCGKSTVMFSNISAKHFVFAYDDRDMPESSVNMVLNSPDFRVKTTQFVYGPTQRTLPRFDFPAGHFFDVVVIDGPHGYPFPDLEYAILYPYLKEGSVLIIDDIHIPSIGHMYDLLRTDRMYDEVGVFATTGVLRRTGVKGVPPDGDHWYEQNYNVSQFPRSMEKYHLDRSVQFGEEVDFTKPHVVLRHTQRGLEYSPAYNCATTIDIGAVVEFALPKASGQVHVEINYCSIYEAAAAAASLVSGATSALLPFHGVPETRSFDVPVSPDGRVLLTFLHPNAAPEHDLGTQRYEFRRLGIRIRSLTFKDQGSVSYVPVLQAVKLGPLKKLERRIKSVWKK
jgi:hypothetical protein